MADGIGPTCDVAVPHYLSRSCRRHSAVACPTAAASSQPQPIMSNIALFFPDYCLSSKPAIDGAAWQSVKPLS
ncbi:hypothetical protein BDA96_01G572000 [Sorghum bicolor]|uniref:Uncharacterized protein n=1 Tax=Sorghum bicolor TaxID=4558 RepID=A0A921S7Y5_SORBI|nr:hypothetical protein BDA96_01G572000 [Sorghum bicolor]